LDDDNPNIEQLEDSRKSIDNLDSAIIAILAERFRQTEKIGMTKAKGGFKPEDPEREQQQLEQFRKRAKSHDLNADVVVDIMTRIIHHVKNRHEVLGAAAGHRQSTSKSLPTVARGHFVSACVSLVRSARDRFRRPPRGSIR
jgi:chorismate mutase